jgi:hypothetical protein
MDIPEQLGDARKAESLVDDRQVKSTSMSAKVRPGVSIEVEVLAVQLVQIKQEADNDGEHIIIQSIEQ